MGLLDDAIREHLDLKRRRGADPAEVARSEQEALGPVRRDAPAHEDAPAEPEHPEAHHDEQPAPEPEAAPEDAATHAPAPEPESEPEPEPAPPAEDVLEETPDFLQETPEHDRLWFEQRPPRDFDFDG